MAKKMAAAKSKPSGGQKRTRKLKTLHRGSLKNALRSSMKLEATKAYEAVGQKLNFTVASSKATQAYLNIPAEKRAGYPVSRAKGSVDPKKWVTSGGKKVQIDFARRIWLPDDWAQGVKSTNPIGTGRIGSGGSYTVYLSPDGKTFYHQKCCEEHSGRKFGPFDGFQGAMREAQLQFEQMVKWNHSEEALFKTLTAKERKHLPSKDAFHFGIISARRANTASGVADIAKVEQAFKNQGVKPTWYVDADSVKDYKALGLDAKVGGALTKARNLALKDAYNKNKVCVQVSDDISAWEYRIGAIAKEKTDAAVNAAYEKAKRYILSPVAAARFMLAKMRSVPEKNKPKLGGVYMLGSCARTFAAPSPVSRRHFILGDFFVAEKSKVRFDEGMTLKEDYDFTASHITEHGSVMRFNRMTISAKHYTNTGGACSNRDKKGIKERKNINILFTKWPKAFMKHPKRANEVVMRWPVKYNAEDIDDEAVGKEKDAL
eukprot:TRINITY_DN53361_c0_g1_i1.p1 TRINITY_DN53361_c0_g1~~TRINITY_DN53361_c0_g1_i1.p1  ORF type:complete len:488 (+),score=151.55 TRINITY_DN53361_c0_g1_i1:72-1535(+)